MAATLYAWSMQSNEGFPESMGHFRRTRFIDSAECCRILLPLGWDIWPWNWWSYVSRRWRRTICFMSWWSWCTSEMSRRAALLLLLLMYCVYYGSLCFPMKEYWRLSIPRCHLFIYHVSPYLKRPAEKLSNRPLAMINAPSRLRQNDKWMLVDFIQVNARSRRTHGQPVRLEQRI